MINDNIALLKSKKFAVRIVKLATFIRERYREYSLADQILRSGTSIGANLSESESAISKADFLNKIYTSLKECNETLFWIDLLSDCGFINNAMHKSMYRDCEEIRRILSATTRTVKSQLKIKSQICENE